MVGGLCLDESGYICVTARNVSNNRILYSFDDLFNVVTRVQLAEFDEYGFVLDMLKEFVLF